MAKKQNPFGLSDATMSSMSPEDLKLLEKANKEYNKIEDRTSSINSLWDSIAFTVAGISRSDYFVKVAASAKDIATAQDTFEELKEVIKETSITLNNDFTKAIGNNQNKLLKLIETAKGLSPQLSESLKEAVSSGNIGEFLKKEGEIGRKALISLVEDKKGFKKFYDSLKKNGDVHAGFLQLNQHLKEVSSALKNPTQDLVSWQKITTSIGANILKAFSPQNLAPFIKDFDNIVNHTQRDFGIEMDGNVDKFSALNTQSARFGIGAKENAEFMGKLGEGLQNTNFDVLSAAANDMMAVHQATGLSTDAVEDLTQKMMFFGTSSKSTSKFVNDTMNQSLKYGLNSKKILTEFTKQIPNAKALGWAGGVTALRDMVIQAEKLGQNMDGLAASAKKLRTLEGSLEASADLALMGVNVNALQMLGAARRGGKDFSNLIADMTKGIGGLKAKSNEVEFTGLDIDRLQGIADATGQSVEDLQKQITKSVTKNAKEKLLPSSFFSIPDDQKQFLLDATELGENGEIKIKGSIGGVTDLAKLTPDAIKAAMAQSKTLEEYADKNKSLEDSIKGLKESVKYMATFLQPVIAWVTTLIQTFNKWFSEASIFAKSFVAGIAIFGAVLFSAAKHFYNGYTMGMGFNSATTKGGFLKGLGSFLNPFKAKAVTSVATSTVASSVGGTLPGALPNNNQTQQVSKLSQAFKAMPSPAQILALAAALVAFGFAIFEIGHGIKAAAEGLSELVKSFDGITNAGYAMGAVIGVMGGMVGIVFALSFAVKALGAAGTEGAIGLLAIGASVLLISGGIWLISEGMANMVQSFKGLTGGEALAALGSIAVLMWGMVSVVGILAAELPFLAGGIAAAGAAAEFTALGWLALGAAAVGIGFGIKLAGEGIASIIDSIGNLAKSLGDISINSIGILSTAFALGILTASLISLSASSFLIGPGLLLLSGGLMLTGLALKFIAPSLETIAQAKFDSINTLSTNLEILSKSIPGVALGLLYLSPALIGIGVAGLVGFPGLMAASIGIAALGAAISVAAPGLDMLSNLKLTNFSEIGSGLLKLTPGILAFAAVSALAPLIILGAGSLLVLSESLNVSANAFTKLGQVNWDNVSIMGNSLLNLTPGLLAFSTVGIVSPLIILAGAAISSVGLGLNLLSGIDLKIISGFGDALGNNVEGLWKFSSLGLVAPLIVLAGTAIGLVGLGMKYIQDVDTAKLSGFGDALGNNVGGLLKFAALGLVSPLLLASGLAIGAIVGGLSLLKDTNLSSVGQLSGTLDASVNGFMKFALIGAVSPLLEKAGNALNALASSAVSLNNLKIDTIEKVGNSFGASVSGFIKFASLGLFAPLLYLAGNSISGLLQNISKIGDTNTALISNIGNALGNSVPGLWKFASLGIVAPLIVLAGTAVGLVGIGLKSLQDINIAKLSGFGDALGNNVGGLWKFASLGIVAPLLLLAGKAVSSVMLGLSNLKDVSVDKISQLSDTLSSSVGGFVKFSAIGLFYSSLQKAGTSINELANSTNNIKNTNTGAVQIMSASLGDSIGGFLKFAIIGLTAPLLLLAGEILSNLSTSVVQIAGANFSKFTDFSAALGNSTLDFIEFSTVGLVAPLLFLAGTSIKIVSEMLSQLGNIDPSSIANALGNSTIGLLEFSTVGLVAPLLIMAGTALGLISVGLSKLDGVNLTTITGLGDALASNTIGLLEFSTVGLVAPLLLAAATSFGALGAGLSYLKDISVSSMSGLSNILPSLSLALLKFSVVGLASPLLLGAAMGISLLSAALLSVGPALTMLATLDWGTLGTLGDTLKEMMPGLSIFAGIGLLSIPIILGATALFVAGKMLNVAASGFESFNNVKLDGLKKLGTEISPILDGLENIAMIGVIAIPIAFGAVLLSGAGKLLSGAANGFNSFSKIDWVSIKSASSSLSELANSLLDSVYIGVAAIPILAGATILSLAGGLFKLASYGFIAMANVDWTALKGMSSSLLSIIPGLFAFASVGFVSSFIIAGAISVGIAGASLWLAAKGFNAMADVNWNGFSTMSDSLKKAIPALLGMTLLSAVAIPILVGATMLGIAGAMLSVASLGFMSLEKVNWKSLNSFGPALLTMIPGLFAFASIGIVSPLIALAGLAMSLVGLGLASLSLVKIDVLKEVGSTLLGLIPALAGFSIIGLLSAPIALAGGALLVLGLSLAAVSNGINAIATINWKGFKEASSGLSSSIPTFLGFALLGLAAGPIIVGAAALAAIGLSMNVAANGFTAMAGINWGKIDTMGNSLDSLIPKLLNFGGGGLLAVPGLYLINSVLSDLSETMNSLAPALDLASKSMDSMSSGMEKFKTAIKGVDTSALNSFADFSDKIISSQVNAVPVAGAQQVATPNKPGKIEISPITINLKLNGRDIHQEIVEANAHTS